MLKIKEKYPYTLPTPVEAALEANEAAIMPNRKNIDKKAIKPNQIRMKFQHQQSDESMPKLVRVPAGTLPPFEISPTKRINSNHMDKSKIFHIESEHFEYIGKEDCEAIPQTVTKVRYEIPESRLSRTASLILGNRKELEMHEFSSPSLRANEDATECNDTNRRNPTIPEIDPSGDRQPIE